MTHEPLFISAVRRRIRRIRWRLGARRCVCGAHVLAPRTTMELAGVKHRTDGPCFRCDAYGEPL
jgi:hypothetical protein